MDAGGQPVAGATVSATVSGAVYSQRPVTAVTLPDGTWSMQVSPGNWTLGAIAPGYSPSAITTESFKGAVSGISLTLGATLPGTVSGTVNGSGGTPLPDALVTAVNTSTHDVFQTQTAADGTYSLPVADGSYDVTAGVSGYMPQTAASPVTVAGAASVTQNFTLASGVAVGGSVTVGGTAAAGVEVDAVSAANPGVIVTTSTGAAGGYTLNLMLGMAPGTGTTRFSDAPAGAWFAPYVSAAMGAGIVNGTSPTTFDPNGTLTREQMAVLLWR